MVDESFKPKLVKCEKWLLFSRKNGDIYCIGNDETGDFVKVPGDEVAVIESVIHYFDGKRSIKWIHDRILETMDLDVSVGRIFEIFRKANLIENSPSENPDEFQITSTMLIRKNLRALFKGHPRLTGIIFYPIFLLGTLSTILGLGLFILNYNNFHSADIFSIEESTALGIMVSFIIIYASSFVHEMGHVITAWHFGVPPKEVRVLLYLGCFPMLFLNIPNIYTISRRRRIFISLAGVYTNLVVASLAALFLFIFKPAPLIHQFLIQITLLNIITPIFILNPFLPGDGYFLAVNAFKTPNIRKHAFEKLRKLFRAEWSKKDILFIAYGLISISISAYFFYWFVTWFSFALIETLSTLYTLSTLTNYLFLGLKVAFFGLMLYSCVKTIYNMMQRSRKPSI